MGVVFWIVTGLTAAGFLLAGSMKALRPKPALKSSGMGWVDDFPATTVKAIGVVEVIGAVGLVVPPLTGILPWLGIVAAIGLVAIMIGAVVVHLRRKESAVPAYVFLALAAAAAILGIVTL